MILVGEMQLSRAIARHPDAAGWIEAWIKTIRAMKWNSIIDVRRTYPSADGVKLDGGMVVTVFNVAGNKYRLLAQIDYAAGLVQFRQLLTHAEYDKQKWKR